METRDLPLFTQMLHRIAALFDKSLSQPWVEIYWESLQRFDIQDIRRAFSAHVQNPDTGQFLPKPADVVRFLEGSSQTQSLQAWTKVVDTIRNVGGYTSVAFDDPLIHAVIRDMGGWTKLCEVTVQELPFCAKDFQARYAGYVGHPPGQYPTVLFGRLTEPTDTPVFIGDTAKAKALYAQGTGSLTPLGEHP